MNIWTITVIDALNPACTEVIGVYSSKAKAMAQLITMSNAYKIVDCRDDCSWGGIRYYADGKNNHKYMIDLEEHELNATYMVL